MAEFAAVPVKYMIWYLSVSFAQPLLIVNVTSGILFTGLEVEGPGTVRLVLGLRGICGFEEN